MTTLVSISDIAAMRAEHRRALGGRLYQTQGENTYRLGNSQVVCGRWLRGLCSRRDACAELHVTDTSRMPRCHFHDSDICTYGVHCVYKHVDRLPRCPDYAAGFCRRGKACGYSHVLRIACPAYALGFCRNGADCSLAQ